MTSPTSGRLPGRSAALILSAFVAVVGLGAGAAAPAADRGELDWARDALARNGALEIVSTDPATSVVTVRVKSTGELRQVHADDVIGALPPDAHSAGSTHASSRIPAVPAGERVIASGPGYTIAAAGPPSAAGVQPASVQDAAARNLPLERRHEPIVCQGARLLHIDGRNLEFDGDAVLAEKGCELHITNSSISAKGVGVAVRDASVHIDNSFISGSEGSVAASDGAQVYARSSTFKGLIRRNDTAAFHDLGGNVGN